MEDNSRVPLDKSGDWDQFLINAHSLKPQAEFMGILSLKDELIKIEEAVKMNDLDVLEELYSKALTLSRQSEHMLKEMLDQF